MRFKIKTKSMDRLKSELKDFVIDSTGIEGWDRFNPVLDVCYNHFKAVCDLDIEAEQIDTGDFKLYRFKKSESDPYYV